MYHIAERKCCRCGRFPPEVRTAIPVDGRFEHIVLSCNATSDHGIIWIEREAQKALDMMKEGVTKLAAPAKKTMTRQQTIQEEHKGALERAISLNVPYAVTSLEEPVAETGAIVQSMPAGRINWEELVQRLFDKDETGKLVFKQDVAK